MVKRKSVKPLYKLSDTVLCNFRGQLYDAVILETKQVDILEKEQAEANKSENSVENPISIRSVSTENGAVCPDSDGFAYYLHYKNWNSCWDEWVHSNCLMKITEEARDRQQALKLAARKEKIKRNSKKRKRRAGRKSVPSLSQNDNLDEDLSEVGRISETLYSPEPMDDSISNVDEVCADEHELGNEGAEGSGSRTGVGNLDDSTKTSANIQIEVNIPNDGLCTESLVVLHADKSPKSGKASKETSLADSNLVPPVEAATEKKKLESPEKLDTSESVVETTSAKLITSNTTVEVEKRILAGVKSDDDVLLDESKTSIAAQELETDEKHHHLGEVEKVTLLEPEGKERELNANTTHAGIEEHPCFVISAPTINDVLPELQDYLCSISSIGNVLGSAFVKKLGLMYEIFCKEVVLPSTKYGVEQAMIKNGISAFGSILHFSGLLKLISILEDGEWCNATHYKRLQEAEMSYELEDLGTIFFACKEYFEAAKTFLLSKEEYYLQKN